jgi:hypothetical protein
MGLDILLFHALRSFKASEDLPLVNDVLEFSGVHTPRGPSNFAPVATVFK